MTGMVRKNEKVDQTEFTFQQTQYRFIELNRLQVGPVLSFYDHHLNSQKKMSLEFKSLSKMWKKNSEST